MRPSFHSFRRTLTHRLRVTTRATALLTFFTLALAGSSSCSSSSSPPQDGNATDGTSTGGTDGAGTGGADSATGGMSGDAGTGGWPVGDVEEMYPPDSESEQWPRFLHYIRDSSYERLVLEVDSVPEFEPEPSALEDLKAYLEEILAKPQGVEIFLDDQLEAHEQGHEWESEELNQLARDSFDGDEPDALHIHIMYLDGQRTSRNGGTTLGLAWAYKNIAMFKESIESTCSGLPLVEQSTCEKAELAILTHELGHVLGLVDNGLPMVEDHRDPNPDHGRHDENSDCVMYWAYDGEDAVSATKELLGNGERIEFCSPSLADISAAR